MFLRIDKLQVEMSLPSEPDPSAMAAVDELMGGRFGKPTMLNACMFQSLNLRRRQRLHPSLAEGMRHRLHRFSPEDRSEIGAICNGD